MITCQKCGHPCRELRENPGKGPQLVVQCSDRAACVARQRAEKPKRGKS